MADRGELVARLVPLPGPRDEATARTWRGLDEATRTALRRAATDPELAAGIEDPALRDVAADLAATRADRLPLDVAAPVITGLLVLSTVWGFGRAVFPSSADVWLALGLVGLVLTAAVGLRRARGRRRAATEVQRLLGG
jgi:antitoxin (DNA-binding transcriptional repressor) of toxin-antitoxin stability system